jgi:cation diffusion facilitator family transporter
VSSVKEGEKGGRFVLVAALAANLGIALAKFVAAALTGSSAMLTEGFHSAVDSTNQLLMLYGRKRSKRPPDDLHPLGYGRELYFWSFVVAILIFSTGAGLSIYEGIEHIRRPVEMVDPTVNYIVLAVSIVLEGFSFTVALREFAEEKGTQGWWQAVERSKDPTTFIVLFEDIAAMIGLVIAALGVALAQATANPVWDGAASVAIGLVLGAVAIILARESKGLLIGERADRRLIDAIRHAFDYCPEVTRVGRIVTVHIAPDQVFAAIDVDFEDAVPVGAIEALIASAEAKLRAEWPMVLALYVKPKAGAASTQTGAP